MSRKARHPQDTHSSRQPRSPTQAFFPSVFKMLPTTFIFGLFTAGLASAIPASLAARIPDGVAYTVVASEDIPEFIKQGSSNGTEIEARDGLAKRANYGVYLCVDAGFKGHCAHIVAPEGVCGQ